MKEYSKGIYVKFKPEEVEILRSDEGSRSSKYECVYCKNTWSLFLSVNIVATAGIKRWQK